MHKEFGNQTLLLSTKLKIPTPRKDYMVREDLFELLDTACEMSVIYIQGGAGTGKTTLLSSYIRERNLDLVGWLSLDAKITNPYSFWLYVATALCPFLEDGINFLDYMKKSPDIRNLNQLIIMLINQIPSDGDYYLVLDDMHSIGNEELLSSFESFLQFMPENLHLFLLSREEPPVYLGPVAVSGRLLFIASSRMYLSTPEALQFLTQTLKVSYQKEDLLQLTQYAEGWIGGLQLMVAAKSMGPYQSELLKAGGGIAASYLNREIFEHLEEEEKDFLIRTGGFHYFNYEICASIFPAMTYSAYQDLMSTLIRKNLFILVLDEDKEIYRYHNIFSEYLKQLFHQLPLETIHDLRSQVALCLEQQEDYAEAIQIYEENKDYENMIRIASYCDSSFELIPYLDHVPIDTLVENPELAAMCFMYHLWKSNNVEWLKMLFLKFKEKYEESDLFCMLRFAEVYLSHERGILPAQTPLGYQQIEALSLNAVGKSFLLIQNSTILMNTMDYENAEQCIRLALTVLVEKNTYIEFFAKNQLAQIYEEIGKLNSCMECYQQNEIVLQENPSMHGMESNYYFGLLGVYMRRMELEKAQEVLAVCEDLIYKRNVNIDIAVMTLFYHQAEMYFLKNEEQKGLETVRHALATYPHYNILCLLRPLYELECLSILEEDVTKRIIKEIRMEKEFAKQPFTKILYARLLFRTGEIQEAKKELEEVLTFARKSKNLLRLVEAGILKIYMLVNTKTHSKREIQNLTLEVIHYSYENKIVMPLFLDRKTMLPLLFDILLSYQSNPKLICKQEYSFLQETIHLCKGDTTNIIDKKRLTQREMDILRELSLGITNKEISEKLCISQATVKTHVLSIYGKLGVSSRLMAVEQARNENLL